jgi:DNA excision repair protein ERCC-8
MWDVRMAGYLRVLDQHNGEQASMSTSVITSHGGEVNGITFLPGGLQLFTHGTDHRLRLWDVGTGRNELKHYPKVANKYQKKIRMAVAGTAVRPIVFVPTQSNVVGIDVHAATKLPNELRGHYSTVHACVFHPHYEELYTGSNDSEILLWAPPAPRRMLTAEGGGGGGAAVEVDAWSDDDGDGGFATLDIVPG